MAQLRWLVASFTVVTALSWTALYFLPPWFNAAVLGLLIVFVVTFGFIKLVLITPTPPRQ
jgi:hypothetical protein